MLRWGSALVRGLQRRGDAYSCSTRCATSLRIRSNAPLATVYTSIRLDGICWKSSALHRDVRVACCHSLPDAVGFSDA